MSAAIGIGSRQVIAPENTYVVSASMAGSGKAPDLTMYLEEIYADMLVRRKTYSGPLKIYFEPSSTEYFVNKPIFFGDIDNLLIEGGAPSPTLQGTMWGPLLLFGSRRRDVGAEHFVDLYDYVRSGEMDSSVASAAGKRWALRTGDSTSGGQANRMITLPYSPLAVPRRHWRDNRQITISVALRNPTGGALPLSKPTGDQKWNRWYVGNHTVTDNLVSEAHPWNIGASSSPDSVLLELSTTDGEPDPVAGSSSTRRLFGIGLNGATGVVHLTVKIDLVNASITAWVNGIPTPVSGGPNTDPNSGWKPGNLQFQPNYNKGFVIGPLYSHELYGSPNHSQDIVIAGLHVRDGLAFNPTASNHLTTYFTRDDATGRQTIGYLPLQDGPDAAVGGGRLVACIGGAGAGAGGVPVYGLLTDIDGVGPGVGGYIQSHITIRNLRFQPTGNVWSYPYQLGAGVCFGSNITVAVENCQFTGGMTGVGAMGAPGNCWVWKFDGIETSYNYDSGIQVGNCSQVYIRDWYCPLVPATALRNRDGDGCSVQLEDCFFNNINGPTESVIDIKGSLTIKNVSFDQEGVGPTTAAIVVTPAYPNSFVFLRHFDISTVSGANACGILLKSGYSDNYIRIEMPYLWAVPPMGFVVDQGGSWRGEIEYPSLYTDAYIRSLHPDNLTGVKLKSEHAYSGVPRSGCWHGAELTLRPQANGQFTKLQLVRPGEYGTQTPPLFAGSEPLRMDEHSAASSFVDHVYVQSRLSRIGV